MREAGPSPRRCARPASSCTMVEVGPAPPRVSREGGKGKLAFHRRASSSSRALSGCPGSLRGRGCASIL
eukprot:3947-Alexandrium_andersonii.AAC.1